MVKRPDHGIRGYSLIEMLIAMGIGTVVLGAAVLLSAGVQRAYSHELDDAAVQQDARFALQWINRTIASAGSNPYDVSVAECLEADAPFMPLRLDPDGDGADDDIRVQADLNPPNGLIGGAAGACDESGEDVTIALDADTGSLTRFNTVDAAPVAMTAGVFTDLAFTYLTAQRDVATQPAAVAYVAVTLTARSPSRHPITGQYTAFTYQSEIRVRSR